MRLRHSREYRYPLVSVFLPFCQPHELTDLSQVNPRMLDRLTGELLTTTASSPFSQTDFTEDLKKVSVPVLVMHSEDDQIVHYADSGPLTAKLLKNGTLKTYSGFPHGMPTTQAETINADLLAFLEA